MPSVPCVGYCGGHRDRRGMHSTDDGPMCPPCFYQLRVGRRDRRE